MMKKLVTCILVIAVFIAKLREGFALPVVEVGDMASGAMNDPLSVIVSAVLAATAVWAIMQILFWVIAQLRQ